MDSTREQSRGFRTPERWNSVPVPERVAQRAATNVDIQGDGCWISRYSVASHGYAQIGWSIPKAARTGRSRNAMVLAHRASWTHFHGQVPLGMTVDHLCKVRRCVNPEHLRLLPNYENARRVDGADWPIGFCKRGHPNSELRACSGSRGRPSVECRVCRTARIRRNNWVARHPGEPIPPHIAAGTTSEGKAQ